MVKEINCNIKYEIVNEIINTNWEIVWEYEYNSILFEEGKVIYKKKLYIMLIWNILNFIYQLLNQVW